MYVNYSTFSISRIEYESNYSLLIYFIDLIDEREINERIMKWSSIDSYKISRLISFITELLITERI